MGLCIYVKRKEKETEQDTPLHDWFKLPPISASTLVLYPGPCISGLLSMDSYRLLTNLDEDNEMNILHQSIFCVV